MRGRVMGFYGLISAARLIGALQQRYRWRFGLRWPIIAGAVMVIVAAMWTLSRHSEISVALPNSEKAEPAIPTRFFSSGRRKSPAALAF